MTGKTLSGKFWHSENKTVSLSWNLVPRLIRICRVHWWCSLFQFLTRDTLLGKFGPKSQNGQVKLKFVSRLSRICRIRWWCSLFVFLIVNTLFTQIWSKVIKFSIQAEIWYLHKLENAKYLLCFRLDIRFWLNLLQKIKIWYLDQFECAYFNGDVHFFRFWQKYPL